MRTLMTPRKPWSFFLNFFWSKTWTASMLSSVARLENATSNQHEVTLSTGSYETHISKVSFQYGLSVLLITDVVLVCSPLIVATAKGSGKPVGTLCQREERQQRWRRAG